MTLHSFHLPVQTVKTAPEALPPVVLSYPAKEKIRAERGLYDKRLRHALTRRELCEVDGTSRFGSRARGHSAERSVLLRWEEGRLGQAALFFQSAVRARVTYRINCVTPLLRCTWQELSHSRCEPSIGSVRQLSKRANGLIRKSIAGPTPRRSKRLRAVPQGHEPNQTIGRSEERHASSQQAIAAAVIGRSTGTGFTPQSVVC
jgi:hypothetical protein